MTKMYAFMTCAFMTHLVAFVTAFEFRLHLWKLCFPTNYLYFSRDSYEWIHVICAWWIPEVRIEDTKYIERITKDKIPVRGEFINKLWGNELVVRAMDYHCRCPGFLNRWQRGGFNLSSVRNQLDEFQKIFETYLLNCLLVGALSPWENLIQSIKKGL